MQDLDLAVWIDLQDRLGELRRAQDRALQAAYKAGADTSVSASRSTPFSSNRGATAISAGSALRPMPEG